MDRVFVSVGAAGAQGGGGGAAAAGAGFPTDPLTVLSQQLAALLLLSCLDLPGHVRLATNATAAAGGDAALPLGGKTLDVHNQLSQYAAVPSSALLLLCWAGCLRLLETSGGGGGGVVAHMIRDLDGAARELEARAGAAGGLAAAAASLEALCGGAVGALLLVYRGVATKALCVLCTAFDLGVDTLDAGTYGVVEELVKLCVEGDARACAALWDESQPTFAPLRALLAAAARLFPAMPHPLLQLLRVATASPATARAAYTYLQRAVSLVVLHSTTEPVIRQLGGGEVELTSALPWNLAPSVPGLALPQGCVGTLCPLPSQLSELRGRFMLVGWEAEVSGGGAQSRGQVLLLGRASHCVAFLEHALHHHLPLAPPSDPAVLPDLAASLGLLAALCGQEPALVADLMTQSVRFGFGTTRSWTDVVTGVLALGPQLAARLVAKATPSAPPPLQLLSDAAQLLAAVAALAPGRVLALLPQLPLLASPAGDVLAGLPAAVPVDALPSFTVPPGIEAFTGLLPGWAALQRDLERPAGRYPLTTALLDLMAGLLERGFMAAPLPVAVLFVLHELLPSHHHWRFAHAKERWALTRGSLRILRLAVTVDAHVSDPDISTLAAVPSMQSSTSTSGALVVPSSLTSSSVGPFTLTDDGTAATSLTPEALLQASCPRLHVSALSAALLKLLLLHGGVLMTRCLPPPAETLERLRAEDPSRPELPLLEAAAGELLQLVPPLLAAASAHPKEQPFEEFLLAGQDPTPAAHVASYLAYHEADAEGGPPEKQLSYLALRALLALSASLARPVAVRALPGASLALALPPDSPAQACLRALLRGDAAAAHPAHYALTAALAAAAVGAHDKLLDSLLFPSELEEQQAAERRRRLAGDAATPGRSGAAAATSSVVTAAAAGGAGRRAAGMGGRIRHALDGLYGTLQQAGRLKCEQPRVLAATLQVLAAMWQQPAAAYRAVAVLRSAPDTWTALDACLVPVTSGPRGGAPPGSAGGSGSGGIPQPGTHGGDVATDVEAHRMLCEAYALQILTAEAYARARTQSTGGGGVNGQGNGAGPIGTPGTPGLSGLGGGILGTPTAGVMATPTVASAAAAVAAAAAAAGEGAGGSGGPGGAAAAAASALLDKVVREGVLLRLLQRYGTASGVLGAAAGGGGAVAYSGAVAAALGALQRSAAALYLEMGAEVVAGLWEPAGEPDGVALAAAVREELSGVRSLLSQGAASLSDIQRVHDELLAGLAPGGPTSPGGQSAAPTDWEAVMGGPAATRPLAALLRRQCLGAALVNRSYSLLSDLSPPPGGQLLAPGVPLLSPARLGVLLGPAGEVLQSADLLLAAVGELNGLTSLSEARLALLQSACALTALLAHDNRLLPTPHNPPSSSSSAPPLTTSSLIALLLDPLPPQTSPPSTAPPSTPATPAPFTSSSSTASGAGGLLTTAAALCGSALGALLTWSAHPDSRPTLAPDWGLRRLHAQHLAAALAAARLLLAVMQAAKPMLAVAARSPAAAPTFLPFVVRLAQQLGGWLRSLAAAPPPQCPPGMTSGISDALGGALLLALAALPAGAADGVGAGAGGGSVDLSPLVGGPRESLAGGGGAGLQGPERQQLAAALVAAVPMLCDMTSSGSLAPALAAQLLLETTRHLATPDWLPLLLARLDLGTHILAAAGRAASLVAAAGGSGGAVSALRSNAGGDAAAAAGDLGLLSLALVVAQAPEGARALYDRGVVQQLVSAGRHLLSAAGGRLAAFSVIAVTGTGPYRPRIDGTYPSAEEGAFGSGGGNGSGGGGMFSDAFALVARGSVGVSAAAPAPETDTCGAYVTSAAAAPGSGGAGGGDVWSPVHRQWCTLLQFAAAMLRTLGQHVNMEPEALDLLLALEPRLLLAVLPPGGDSLQPLTLAGAVELEGALFLLCQLSHYLGGWHMVLPTSLLHFRTAVSTLLTWLAQPALNKNFAVDCRPRIPREATLAAIPAAGIPAVNGWFRTCTAGAASGTTMAADGRDVAATSSGGVASGGGLGSPIPGLGGGVSSPRVADAGFGLGSLGGGLMSPPGGLGLGVGLGGLVGTPASIATHRRVSSGFSSAAGGAAAAAAAAAGVGGGGMNTSNGGNSGGGGNGGGGGGGLCSEYGAQLAEKLYTCAHHALVFLAASSPQLSPGEAAHLGPAWPRPRDLAALLEQCRAASETLSNAPGSDSAVVQARRTSQLRLLARVGQLSSQFLGLMGLGAPVVGMMGSGVGAAGGGGPGGLGSGGLREQVGGSREWMAAAEMGLGMGTPGLGGGGAGGSLGLGGGFGLMGSLGMSAIHAS